MSDTTNGASPVPDDLDELRADIDQTRVELVETVASLAAKADVKSQVSEKAHQVGEHARDTMADVKGAAPPQVHAAVDRAGAVVAPATNKTLTTLRANQKTVTIAVTVLFVVVVLRRSRRRSAERARRPAERVDP
jgi:hypothetical protein